MYLNDGRILNDPARIERLCNADINFESSWDVVQKKFTEKNGYLTHKRVRKELAKAKKFIQHQRNAGLASAAARQPRPNRGSAAVQPPMQPNKTKESKVKQREKSNTFVPPTIEEVEECVKQRGYDVDAISFVAHYEANGWLVGRNKMKNWRAAVAYWSRSDIGQKDMKKRRTCSTSGCGRLGIHKSFDNTGQASWKCEVHKPLPAPSKAPQFCKDSLKNIPKPRDIQASKVKALKRAKEL